MGYPLSFGGKPGCRCIECAVRKSWHCNGGKIQNNNSAGYVIIDLATGEIKSYNDTDLATLLIKAGKFTMTGKDPNTILVELGISLKTDFQEWFLISAYLSSRVRLVLMERLRRTSH